MTCTCKAELASILRDEARQWHDADDKNLARAFACVADRLCPQAEPLDGWRAKCKIGNQSNTDWWIRFTSDDGLYLWYHHTTGWVGEPHQLRQPCYPTASAARAALLAASEPGVEPARGPCTCNRNHVDDDEHAPDCGKPSPAPAVAFDAEKVAEGMLSLSDEDSLNIHSHDPNGVGWSVWIIDGAQKARAHEAKRLWAGYIAAALRAAHSIGDAAGYARAKAEQTPRKWPDGYNDWHAQNPGHSPYVHCWLSVADGWYVVEVARMRDGEFWMPMPAAPAAAKEPPHAD